MWAKLVTLNTLFWYCDGPEPTAAAHRYDFQVRQRKFVTQHFFFFFFHNIKIFTSVHLCAEMDTTRKRAYIK